jgi:hypothetical protein
MNTRNNVLPRTAADRPVSYRSAFLRAAMPRKKDSPKTDKIRTGHIAVLLFTGSQNKN